MTTWSRAAAEKIAAHQYGSLGAVTDPDFVDTTERIILDSLPAPRGLDELAKAVIFKAACSAYPALEDYDEVYAEALPRVLPLLQSHLSSLPAPRGLDELALALGQECARMTTPDFGETCLHSREAEADLFRERLLPLLRTHLAAESERVREALEKIRNWVDPVGGGMSENAVDWKNCCAWAAHEIDAALASLPRGEEKNDA